MSPLGALTLVALVAVGAAIGWTFAVWIEDRLARRRIVWEIERRTEALRDRVDEEIRRMDECARIQVRANERVLEMVRELRDEQDDEPWK